MNIQLVVFDMAGTTVKDENNVHICLQNSLKKEGIDASIDEINQVMGIPKPIAIKALLEQKSDNPSQINEDFIEKIHRSFLAEMISFYETNPHVGEKEGASEVFDKLKEAGIKVVLDTGFTRDIADTLLKRLGWFDKIDASVTSDEVEKGRPYPDMIFRAMEITGIDKAEQVAKVGDTISDLQEGYSAGCKLVIGVTTGAFSKPELAKVSYTHLIENLSEILPILNIY